MPLKNCAHYFRLFRLRNVLSNSSIFLISMAVHPFFANAAITIDPIAINISGTVVANAACTFNSNEDINVEFGDVWISEIAGDTYKKPVPYTLSCAGDADGKNIQLRWVGTVASFNGKLLKTDVTGLGIELRQNSSQVNPNVWFTIDSTSPPPLDVVVVKQPDASFTNGQEFNASVTLEVAYN